MYRVGSDGALCRVQGRGAVAPNGNSAWLLARRDPVSEPRWACRERQSYVADDGGLHIVAERARIQAAVAGLDLGRARLLTRLSLFWVRRVRCGPGSGA